MGTYAKTKLDNSNPTQAIDAKVFEEAVEALQTQNVLKITGEGRRRLIRRLINSDETQF